MPCDLLKQEVAERKENGLGLIFSSTQKTGGGKHVLSKFHPVSECVSEHQGKNYAQKEVCLDFSVREKERDRDRERQTHGGGGREGGGDPSLHNLEKGTGSLREP